MPDRAAHDAAVQNLLNLAATNGIGRDFRKVFDSALAYGMYPRTYKWSIMYTPPQNRTRVLVCVWVTPVRGRLKIYINSLAFAEFYTISAQDALKILGRPRFYRFSPDDVEIFLHDLDEIFARIAKNA